MSHTKRRRLRIGRIGTVGIVVSIVCITWAWNVSKVDGAAQDPPP